MDAATLVLFTALQKKVEADARQDFYQKNCSQYVFPVDGVPNAWGSVVECRPLAQTFCDPIPGGGVSCGEAPPRPQIGQPQAPPPLPQPRPTRRICQPKPGGGFICSDQ